MNLLRTSLLLPLLLTAGIAHAETDPAPAQAAETPQTTAPSTTSADEISLEDWERTDWALVKPEVALLEVDGYFRFRAGLFRGLNFGNGGLIERTAADRRYPINDDGKANTSYADMRLRIMPQMNITENISVVMTFDVMDNLVLGSTPDSAYGTSTPVHTLSTGQQARSDDARDLLIARHAYAKLTALNEQLELRVGRMPDHFGLGMLYNSGMCIDCDFDRTVDRAAVSFRLAGHTIGAMFDWVGTGPTWAPFNNNGPNVDGAVWSDAVEYGLRVNKEDHPDDIRERSKRGELVLNYGMHNGIRVQKSGVGSGYYADARDVSLEKLSTAENATRDALLYTGDAYLKLYYGNLRLGLEAAIQVGSFEDTALVTDTRLQTDVLTWGLALEAQYALEGAAKGTLVTFKAGVASGDDAPGFGALEHQAGQRTQGADDAAGATDRSINNFSFNPNYASGLDMLVYRRIIGTVTDSFYLRPAVSYDFNEDFSGEVAVIYSQALEVGSTPSCNTGSGTRTDCDGGQRPMAIEFDAEVSYGLAKTHLGGDTQRVRASFAGAVAVPFGAFEALSENNADPSLAWMLQGRLYVTF